MVVIARAIRIFRLRSSGCSICTVPIRDIIRGQHANRESEFVLINVGGTSKVKVDNGFETDIIELNKPRMGLYIPTMMWKDMYDFYFGFRFCWYSPAPITMPASISVTMMNS